MQDPREFDRLVRLIAVLTELHPKSVRACLTESKRVSRSTARAVAKTLPRAKEILSEQA